MKLNRVERALMNNPVRAAIQWHYEARVFERLIGSAAGLRVLEVGCGRGVGTEILVRRMRARHVAAFDLDPEMARLAADRLASVGGERAGVFVGSADAIAAADERYDLVVDFGILHHVPVWRDAIAEIARVLRPGGRFYFEEVSARGLDRWIYRTLLDHPSEDRFSRGRFVEALAGAGLWVECQPIEIVFGDFFLGAARKTP